MYEYEKAEGKGLAYTKEKFWKKSTKWFKNLIRNEEIIYAEKSPYNRDRTPNRRRQQYQEIDRSLLPTYLESAQYFKAKWGAGGGGMNAILPNGASPYGPPAQIHGGQAYGGPHNGHHASWIDLTGQNF